MSNKHPERGSVHTRRNLAEFAGGDPYQPHFDAGEVAACSQCHALYQRRHWFFDEAAYVQTIQHPNTRVIVCPACQKIHDRYAEGQVTLRASPFLQAHRVEILQLVHNEEERAKGLNPLERIIDIDEGEEAIIVSTTNEKLAQRIGRMLKSAYQGQTTYRWSEPRFLSVEWHRP